MGGLSRTCVVREGRRYFYVHAASSKRESYGQAFSIYTFDNVNYVSCCTVRGASVFMLEYRSVDSAC